MNRTAASLFAITALLLPIAAAAEPAAPGAEATLERMLVALGGREAWARTTATMNDSQQNRAQEPAVVRATIHMDFTRPRFRVETRGEGLHLVRVVDGERHWRIDREGRRGPVPDEVLADDRRWYGAHVYRTLHRLAARDPALTVRLADDGRLDVHDGERRVAWYRLDSRGEPYAFGAWDDEAGSLCGPWIHEVGGIRHPAWVSNRDGTWRAMLKRLEVNPPLPDALFAEPTDAEP